ITPKQATTEGTLYPSHCVIDPDEPARDAVRVPGRSTRRTAEQCHYQAPVRTDLPCLCNRETPRRCANGEDSCKTLCSRSSMTTVNTCVFLIRSLWLLLPQVREDSRMSFVVNDDPKMSSLRLVSSQAQCILKDRRVEEELKVGPHATAATVSLSEAA
ncbi:hypothetical protein BD413DRAFT_578186, partial [Trametes elegans]